MPERKQIIVHGYGEWDIGNAVANGLPLSEEWERYMAAQDPAYREDLLTKADTLAGHATESYGEIDRAQAATGMLIAAEEFELVGRALEQYALSRNPPRRRIVGYLNWPADMGGDDHTVVRTRAQLDAFIQEHSEVPFAYCEGVLPEGELIIGGLRKLVTDLALDQTVWPTKGDIMLSNDDADTMWTARFLERRKYDAFASPGDYPFVSVTHSVTRVLVPNLPNMNTVIHWHDDPRLLTLSRGYYEPGPAWSARAYMQEPFSPTDGIAETHRLLDRHHQGDSYFHPARLWLPDSLMKLSPRREYYKQLMTIDHGDLQFWTGLPDDLKSTEDYRKYGMRQFVHWKDINTAQRDAQLMERGFILLHSATMSQMRQFPEIEPAQALGRSLALLERLRTELDGPEGMFTTWIDEVKEMVA